MPCPRFAATSLGLACVIAACADAPDSRPDEAFLLTDSAGVVIAESLWPAWGVGGGWRVVAEPELSIGAGAEGGDEPDNPAFGWIRGLQVLSDGRIAVADASVAQVLVFDASGHFTHSFGGQGDGPGELENLGLLQKCDRDTIVTGSPYRRNFFDADGHYIRTVGFGSSSGRPLVWLVAPDCLRFLVSDRVPNPVGDEGLQHLYLAWSDETFAARDTVARVVVAQSQPMSNPAGYVGYAQVPWTTSMLIPVVDEDLILGYGRWAELRSYGPDGNLRRIARWHAEPQPIAAEDRRRFEEERAACLARFEGRTPVEGVCDALSDFTWLPSHKFFFDKLVLDADGNVWARSVSATSLGSGDANRRRERPGPEHWTVLTSSGEWLGTVQMPDGLVLEQVANGRVYGVHRDELGVATVRVHLIEKVGDAS